VNELAASGAVRRLVEDAQLRSPRLELTGRGRDVLTTLWKATTPHRDRALEQANVGREELDAARATIRKVIAALRAADQR
jgi:DNA-binding MarR family transcriptional regulator